MSIAAGTRSACRHCGKAVILALVDDEDIQYWEHISDSGEYCHDHTTLTAAPTICEACNRPTSATLPRRPSVDDDFTIQVGPCCDPELHEVEEELDEDHEQDEPAYTRDDWLADRADEAYDRMKDGD